MTIASAIENAKTKIANCYTAISGKGGTLPTTQNLENMPTAINSISGGDTLTVTNTTGSEITKNGKVWIKYDTTTSSYKAVAIDSVDSYTFTGVALADAAANASFSVSCVKPNQSTLLINPTPTDATVALTASGGYITYGTNSITVDSGTNVSYKVSKEGYKSQNNSMLLYSDLILNIVLEEGGGEFDPSVLVFGDRLGDGDGIATVVGRFEASDKTYVYAVLDAKYMNETTWGVYGTDTGLPNYTSSSAALAAKESATYNTDYILNNYTASSYPAFNHCDTCTSVELGGETYKPKLPNAYELQQIYTNRSALYALDPTASSYTAYNLANWSFNSSSYTWCSNEYDSYIAWRLGSSGSWRNGSKNNDYGVVPVLEIPLS